MEEGRRKPLTDLHLDEGGLLWQGSRQDPWVAEAGPQQHGYDKEEEDDGKDRDGRGQVNCQVRTPAGATHKKRNKD